MEKKSQIIMPFGSQRRLKSLMNVSYPTIREALRGSNTETCKKIRHMAKQLGGYEVEPVK